MADEFPRMIATNAFRAGAFDKADLRSFAHYHSRLDRIVLPEAGRQLAAREGPATLHASSIASRTAACSRNSSAASIRTSKERARVAFAARARVPLGMVCCSTIWPTKSGMPRRKVKIVLVSAQAAGLGRE